MTAVRRHRFTPDPSTSTLSPVILRSLLLLCIAAGAVAAADWPQFRGPTGLGNTEERDLPLSWSAKTGENIAWRAALPKSDNAWSSPIVAGGRVFVTCAQNEPLAHHVLCFDAKDGKQLWDTVIPPGPWILKDLRGGYGAPTPCTDGKRVFVVFGSAVIAALDFDGKIAWRKDLEKFAFDVALGASPVLFGDTVILDCDQTGKTSSIIAFAQADGAIRWETKRPENGFTHCTPVIAQVAGQPQMFVPANKALQGLDPKTGKLLWWCAAPGDASSVAFDGKLVYSDSGRGGKGVCVDPTGMGDVQATHLRWTYPNIPEGLGSPIIATGLVWRTHSPEILKAIHVADGTLAFSERVAGIPTYASPIATPEGRIYFASAGKTIVLKAGEKLEVLATNDLGEDNRASAAVSAGRIYLRGNKTLYCIGPK
jgi:outer membrane protein assembly factor BamB